MAHNILLGRSDSAEELLSTAKDIRHLAKSLRLEILSLQPFMNFDALRDCEARLQVGKEWIRLCAALGAPWLQVRYCSSQLLHATLQLTWLLSMQVPSSIYPLTDEATTFDLNVVAENIRRLADYAAKYSVGIAYEAPSWGIVLQTWQEIDRVSFAARACFAAGLADSNSPPGHQAGESTQRTTLLGHVSYCNTCSV